ncbi:THAP domain-containing protein 3 [Trachymyrmex cornetzi]|uniref:THAP domain-containing protein 3 n=1 Tax=Trachymyrmex cornetzi TaxID=471704 RepID=A0A151JNL2_9HYME|nr:THAP domain-containing protein 3 [Trachymyrmex cornetzi]
MPKNCCIIKCKNKRKQGFHFFRLPFTRPDALKMWINAIGGNFVPKKNDLICSAHFVHTDFMERSNSSDVRLKNLAVPSVFLEAPASGIIPAIEHDTTPTLEGSTIAMKSSTISSIGITPVPTSAEKNSSAIVWRSILKPKENNATVLASIPSPKTQSTSAIDDTIKLAVRKSSIKVMSSSLLSLKKLVMSPRKKHMWKMIKTLKQKLRRKEEKINSLDNLLKSLRYI